MKKFHNLFMQIFINNIKPSIYLRQFFSIGHQVLIIMKIVYYTLILNRVVDFLIFNFNPINNLYFY